MKGFLNQMEGLGMSKLVVNDFTIPVSITLAEKVGVHEAIFLQQLHYWLKDSDNVYDGHKWVYNSYQGWHEQMPFFTVNQIRRVVRELEKRNLIITGNYNRLKLDKTKWYRINYEAVEQLSKESNNQNLLVDPCKNDACLKNEKKDELAVKQTRPSLETNSNGHQFQLDNAHDNNSTELETQSDNIPEPARHDTGHRTIPKTTTETTPEKMIDDDESARAINPFTFFEENGFGTIGGYLSEKIMAWCDDLSSELVVEAMKLAVEFGCKHWKYVEAILRQWADKGYQSVSDVHAARLHFEEKMAKRRKQKFEKQGRDIPQFAGLDFSAGEEE